MTGAAAADPPVVGPMSTVHAPNGMVASADALATSAGVAVLRAGGNAVDAAIATNAVLAVTAPHLCGLGGDLFALVHGSGDGPVPLVPLALNASGRAGSGADPERLRAEGATVMPFRGDIRSVTMPGCVDGWLELHGRLGRLGLDEVLAPAIGYAEAGFPASPLLVGSARRLPASMPAAADVYLALRRAGELVRRPGAALALRSIVASGRDGFYGGAFGAGLLTLGGGEFTEADLERSSAEWVEPLRLDAWGHELWTIPPNSQGYLTLAGSWLASQLDLGEAPEDGRWAVGTVEAAIAAAYDRPTFLSEGADGGAVLGPAELARRLELCRGEPAALRALLRGGSAAGDTTYLCAVDADGLGVSLIQSNASGFGSLLFEPSTGINLHNRGLGFHLAAGHPAEYGPGRRPPHTLSPALVTQGGALVAVLGTQGGDAQPQILVQVLARLLGGGASPATAIGSRRWILSGSGQGFDTWTDEGGPIVVLEEGAPADWEAALRRRGHPVRWGPAFDSSFGHANLILRRPDGVLAAVADARARIGAAAGH